MSTPHNTEFTIRRSIVAIDGVDVIIKELRIGVLFRLHQDKVPLASEILMRECTSIDISSLTQESLDLLMDEIMALHKGLFEIPKEPREDDQDNFGKVIARLISQGHPDCINYGISFFRDAVLAAEELESERVIGMAYAVRVRNANKEVFGDFIESLKARGKDVSKEKEIAQDVDRLRSAFDD